MFSDYIIYADESGDHNLSSVNPHYPLFVLVFCIINKNDYAKRIVPVFQEIKFDFFGHDMTIFHEHDIRKANSDFNILRSRDIRLEFMAKLTKIISTSPFTVVAAAIDKKKLVSQYTNPNNPYKLALTFCLERSFSFLKDTGQENRTTYLVVESRGAKEDKNLELEFLRTCQGYNYFQRPLPFKLIFADKKVNSTGLQLSDLIARPIGRHLLAPDQTNRAFEIIEQKFRKSPQGVYQGWGLKTFP